MLFPLLRCWLRAVHVGRLDRGVQRVLDHGRVLPVDDCDDPIQRRPHQVVPVVLKGDRLGVGFLASLDDVARLRELAPDDDGDLFLARLHRPAGSRGLEQIERRERSLLRRNLGCIEQFLVVPALEHHERNNLHRRLLLALYLCHVTGPLVAPIYPPYTSVATVTVRESMSLSRISRIPSPGMFTSPSMVLPDNLMIVCPVAVEVMPARSRWDCWSMSRALFGPLILIGFCHARLRIRFMPTGLD